MSELTICNHCLLKRIKREAQKNNLKISILSDAEWGMGGQNIYVHPRDINISSLSNGEDGERAKYRKAWVMEIPDQCCC